MEARSRPDLTDTSAWRALAPQCGVSPYGELNEVVSV